MSKTSSYWDKRAIQRLNDSEKLSEKCIERIKKTYDRAYKNINRELESVYFNYSLDTGLDISKLKEILGAKETGDLWKQLKQQGLDSYVKNNYKSRISRLEQIQAQIYAKAKEVYPQEELEQTMCYQGVVYDTYNKAIYDVQKGLGYNFPFSKIDNNVINTLLSEKWSGKNYSQRIWTNTDILAESLSEIVGGGLLSGQSIAKTSRQIRERFGVAKYYAERLVRTETNHFNNEADAMAYEEMGIDKYVFVATLDQKTSEICQSHDGKKYKYSEKQTGINFPPLHPNCRSKTRGYLGEKLEEKLKRRAINPKTGKVEEIGNINYQEWLNLNVNNQQITNSNTKSSKQISLIEDYTNKYSSEIYQTPYENAIVYDDVGKEIFRKSGEYSKVEFRGQELNDVKGMNLTHNHPTESDYDSMFSKQDLMFAYDNKLKSISTVNKKGKIQTLTRDNSLEYDNLHKPGFLAGDFEREKSKYYSESHDTAKTAQHMEQWLKDNSYRYGYRYNTDTITPKSNLASSDNIQKTSKNDITSKIKNREQQLDEIVTPVSLTKEEHLRCDEVYNSYKENNNENLSIIDNNNYKKLGEVATSGKHATVGFSKEQLDIMDDYPDRSIIAIHNHPGNSTFSPEDIYTMLEYRKLAGIMVVTDDYVYSLKPTFYQNVISKEEIKEFTIWFEKKLGRQYDDLLDKYINFSNNQIRHIGYKNIFESIGWEYGREKRK